MACACYIIFKYADKQNPILDSFTKNFTINKKRIIKKLKP